jgi:hypothetical protein
MDLGSRLADWYTSKWWRDEQYRKIYGEDIACGQMDLAVDRVAEVFDPQWVSTTRYHPALGVLLTEGEFRSGGSRPGKRLARLPGRGPIRLRPRKRGTLTF